MNDVSALRIAIDLVHSPWQARRVRGDPLPADVRILLRIAAGDEQETSRAADAVNRSRQVVCEAATFFIEQVLLHPDADSYRVLGANPAATNGELRRNMAFLLRWLHPDLDRHGERSVYVARVTRAWNDLKTRERRVAYDRQRCEVATDQSLRRKRRSDAPARPNSKRLRQRTSHNGWKPRQPTSYRSHSLYGGARGGLLRRILLLLFGRVVN